MGTSWLPLMADLQACQHAIHPLSHFLSPVQPLPTRSPTQATKAAAKWAAGSDSSGQDATSGSDRAQGGTTNASSFDDPGAHHAAPQGHPVLNRTNSGRMVALFPAPGMGGASLLNSMQSDPAPVSRNSGMEDPSIHAGVWRGALSILS
jgi:hypothetical protein